MENKKTSLLTRIILGSAAVVAFSGCDGGDYNGPYNAWDSYYWFHYNRSRLWKEPPNQPPYFKGTKRRPYFQPRRPQPQRPNIQRPSTQRPGTPRYQRTPTRPSKPSLSRTHRRR